jgi:hypothetical protein
MCLQIERRGLRSSPVLNIIVNVPDPSATANSGLPQIPTALELRRYYFARRRSVGDGKRSALLDSV